jgi:hypothetical protein
MKSEPVKKDFVYYLALFAFGAISLGPGIIGFGYPLVRALVMEIFK